MKRDFQGQKVQSPHTNTEQE
uniref:Uncharacterized protein n=1 Tax=Rhizophora mucronata TaxID=61149 RepID=A0A2P2QAD3_RHIMU